MSFISFCGKGQKILEGVRGHAPPENLLNSLGMHCRVRHLSSKPCLLERPCYYGQPEPTQERRLN